MEIKKYFRAFVFNLAALWIVTQLVEGVSYVGGFQTLLLTALALTVINLLVKPIVKLLLLPVNLLTLGAFRWIANVITLYLVTLFITQFKISAFTFPGFSYQGFIMPSVHLGFIWVLILTSFLMSLIISFLYWLIK